MIKASNVFYFCSPSTLFDGLITVSVMCSLKHRDSCYTLIINLTNHCCTNFTWPGKSLWKHSCSHDVEQTFQIQKDEMKHSLCPFFIYFFVGIPEVIFSSEHFCFCWKRADKQIQDKSYFFLSVLISVSRNCLQVLRYYFIVEVILKKTSLDKHGCRSLLECKSWVV